MRKLSRVLVSVLGLIVCVSTILSGGLLEGSTTWYVDDAVGEMQDGSIENPFDNIQQGIDAAQDGDVVAVMDGRFTGVGNRDIDFKGKAITVQSVNGADNCIIDCQASKEEPHRGLIFNSGETRSSVIDGITITNGYEQQVSGIFVMNDCSPTIKNCIFTQNSGAYAGAMGVASDANPLIIGCVFVDNKASDAAAMKVFERGNPVIINCKFLGNSAGDGGAVLAIDAKLQIVNSLFSANSAQYGGALSVIRSELEIINCTIYNNKASVGGGIYCYSSSLIMANSILYGDEETQSSQLANLNATLSIRFSCLGVLDESLKLAGNIDSHPLFVDPDGADDIFGTLDDDYELTFDSPCLDKGSIDALSGYSFGVDNDGVADVLSFDLLGSNRVVNGKIDLGAIEKQAPTFIVEPASIAIPEGESASFTVKLMSDPQGQFQASVDRLAGSQEIHIASGATLTFDSINYQAGLPVVLSTDSDIDHRDETCLLRISAPGYLNYDLPVTESDNGQDREVLYVDCNASGANNGSSWADAMMSLGEALQIAGEYPQFEEIRVAQGTYRPGGPGFREKSFNLTNGVDIKGGYAGTQGDDPAERDHELYPTILSGDLNGDDKGGSRDDNSYHVVTARHLDSPVVLEGLTITGGNAFGPRPDHYQGGGMHIYRSNIILRNCLLKDNAATHSGGGILNEGGSLDLVNCTLVGNKAVESSGAGLSSIRGQIIAANCVFRNNAARIGGAYYGFYVDFAFNNCVFVGNSASLKSGGTHNQYDVGVYNNCNFVGNSSPDAGGAYFYGAQVSLNNCILWGNQDNNGKVQSSQVTVENGIVKFNSSCVQGWTGQLEGEGNISDDPRFANPNSGNYLLQPYSSCIDVGDDNLAPKDVLDVDCDGDFAEIHPVDIAGRTRILNRSIDIGAYEFHGLSFLTDKRTVLVPEGGTADLKVWLRVRPSEPVKVYVSHNSGDSDLKVVTDTLTFDSADYMTPKTVEFAASGDFDSLNGSASILISCDGYLDTIIKVVEDDSNEIPEVIYVDKSADGGDFGTTWKDAFTDLNKALSMAREYEGIKEIRVAQGIYTPTSNPAERKVSFELIGGVALRGGYAGNSSANPNARDLNRFVTTLSGDIAGNDGPVASPLQIGQDPLRAENSYHVVTVGNTNAPALLDGFKITAGNANDESSHNEKRGAGLYIKVDSAKCDIIDCVFQYSYALEGGAAAYVSGTQFTLRGCQFRQNASGEGAAALVSLKSDLDMMNCLFTENTAKKYSKVWSSNNDAAIVNHCTFFENNGNGEGVVVGLNQSDIELANCIIWGNSFSEGMPIGSVFWGGSSSFNYSCLQGWTPADGGEGNISENPLFYNTEDEKCLLLPWSPCIDAGNPASPYDNEPSANGSRVNMGYHGNTALAAATDGTLFEDNISVAEKERLSRTTYKYTLELSLPNRSGRRITNFVAEMPETAEGAATVLDNEICLPEIAPHSTARSGSFDDYFVVVIDHSIQQSESDFAWKIKSAFSGRDIYVDGEAQGENTGRSWQDAFEYLQDALFAAEYGDRILIAQGKYTPDKGMFQTEGDKESSFRIKQGIQLLGGYAGAAGEDPSQRDHEKYVTRLSGDLNGDDLKDWSNREDNCYFVVTANNVVSRASIDGLFISNGGEKTYHPYNGGAIFSSRGDLELRNCTIENNKSEKGSAIYFDDGTLALSDCILRNNESEYMGPTIRAVSSLMEVKNSQFYANSGSSGAAIRARKSSTAINNCLITDNKSTGIGAVMIYDGPAIIKNSVFKGNTADRGAAIFDHSYDNGIEVVNCLFYENHITDWSEGAAIDSYWSDTLITNCTIFDNSARGSAAGIYVEKCNPVISNCIIWGNRNNEGVNEQSQIGCESENVTPVLNYNCIEGWTGTLGGEGNIGNDPMFVHDDEIGPSDFDLRLAPDSPCIDAGDNSALPADTFYDFDGRDRYFDRLDKADTGKGSAPIIDMGAFEKTAPMPKPGVSMPEIFFCTNDDRHVTEPKVLKIRNRGEGLLQWELEEDCPWLEISKNSGTSEGEIDEVVVTADISGLAIGRYECQITLSCPGAFPETRIIKVLLDHGSILRVPSEYGTIQSAIDAANPGQIIVVSPGTYTGEGNTNVYFRGKAVKVRSLDPDDPGIVSQTIVDCQDDSGGFKFVNGEGRNSKLEGMTVINATQSYSANSYAVYVVDSGATVSKCVFRDNNSTAVYIENSDTLVKDCTITDNSSVGLYACRCYEPAYLEVDGCKISSNSKGIFLSGDIDTKISNCQIYDNLLKGCDFRNALVNISNSAIYDNASQGTGWGLSTERSKGVEIHNCVVTNNGSINQTGGGIKTDSYKVTLVNSIVWNNYGKEVSGSGLEASFSNIKGGYNGICNISRAPLFVPESRDFRLTGDSPCIATGDPRFNNSNEPEPNGGRINMGMYGGTELAQTITDVDSDRLPDSWEKAFSMTVGVDDSEGDRDYDTVPNITEYVLGTNPTDVDSDQDSMPDKWEIAHGTDPIEDDSKLDADEDGLSNVDEFDNDCDPSNPDTDSDGMPDGWEFNFKLDPTQDDAADDNDQDGVSNLDEFKNECNPQDADSDDDQLTDFEELNEHGTDPADSDSDDDGLDDGSELNVHGTDPLDSDTDDDGMDDEWEVAGGLDPLTNDSNLDNDNDGLENIEEYVLGTYPHKKDSDRDGMPDGWEVVHSFNPLGDDATGDYDGDGYSNVTEYVHNTDPESADSQIDPITIRVPEMVEYLQPAINAALDGETIIVADGIYEGKNNIILSIEKPITLKSANGPDNCIIDCRNSVHTSYGIGISGSAADQAVIEGFQVRNANSSGIVCSNSSPLITNCVLVNNITSGIGLYKSSALIDRCRISFNGSTKGSFGSSGTGIEARYDGTPTISNCVVFGNHSTGVQLYGIKGAEIANCIIADNAKSMDYDLAGIYYEGHPVGSHALVISDSTIINNSAPAISFDGRDVRIENTVMWGNRQGISSNDYSGLAVQGCIVQGGWEGDGNMDVDPLVTPDGHLRKDSPCIDYGPEQTEPADFYDIDGEPRYVGRLDIGADEFVDSDDDGLPDWWELKHFDSKTEAIAANDTDNDSFTNLDEYDDFSSNPLSTTVYVDPSRPDNSGDGLTTGSAKQTIKAALKIAGNHDVIVLADGIYEGQDNVHNEISRKALIIKSANGPDKCILDCQGYAYGFAYNAEYGNSNGTVLKGVSIINTASECVKIEGAARVLFDDCVFSDSSGNGISAKDSYPVIINSSVESNQQSGMSLERGTVAVVNNCDVLNNKQRGIFHTGSSLKISVSSMISNGFYGLCASGSSNITNCLIAGQSSGTGLLLYPGNHEVVNCTIADNDAGIGLYTSYSSYDNTAVISNCILWNRSLQISNGRSSWDVMVSYSDVRDGWEGEGNIDVEPLFADPIFYDYHLRSRAGRWMDDIYDFRDLSADGIIDFHDFALMSKVWQAEGQALSADFNGNGRVCFADLQILLDRYLWAYEPGHWVSDEVNSPCIDAGDPQSDYISEVPNNGGRINMGAYGGTNQASKTEE
ncbi:nitrous oxide reductase family maturation protein NosD [Anaerohalosphaera lusitana]|uniref:Probable pectate lyase C n=1 Tax=Anaerohalosphaera lusitana TaxID=1936003 RepID=A0A1U9NLU9_9BACT|nr:right-handed parallel beta-helix repeat-containing protein [Anaerohalosphaera lusitana]AQT68805.1 nitrous oxide reductase family maturation protein NosD [Anaerohalosphaera lusitana]